MNLLLASGTPHLPQLSGGLEVNSHLAALELNRRGHRASVLAKLHGELPCPAGCLP